MVSFENAVAFCQHELLSYLRNGPKKPLGRQAAELARLARLYRYPPYQYLKAGLYLRAAADVDIDDYLPPALIQKLQNRLNPREALTLAGDKVAFRRALEPRGLPVLREILSTDRAGQAFDGEDRPLAPAEALARLRSHDGEIFVKPRGGSFGRDAGRLAPEAITAGLVTRPNLLFQPRLEQHPVLAALYPNAVNTVRIDTLLTGEGECLHDAAVLKVGVGGAEVDNGTAGGLIVGIDLETGALDPVGRQRHAFSDEDYDRHPDTGAPFAGVVVPHWDLVRATVRQAAEAMRPLVTLGWDVAITPGGVCLLEANCNWGVNILQTARRGMGGTPVGRMACRLHGVGGAPGPFGAAMRPARARC